MKATIEFELPADQDSYRDAMNGARWRAFAQGIEQMLIVMETTETRPDAQETYTNILRRMRFERAGAGLTYLSTAALAENAEIHAKRHADLLDAYLDKQGLSGFKTSKTGDSRTKETTSAGQNQTADTEDDERD